MSIADMSWAMWFHRSGKNGARVLTCLVEDPELVAKLKLLAAEMELRVEISDLASGPNPAVSVYPPPAAPAADLKIPKKN